MSASTAADYSEPILLSTAAQDHNAYHTQDQEPDTEMIPTNRPRIVNHTAQVSERLSEPRDSEGLTPSSQSQRDDPPSASEPHNIAPEVPDSQEPVLGHGTGDSHEDEHQQDGHYGQHSEIEVDSDDEDSALGGETQSITRSLDSIVHDYREEYGRTYHGYKDGKYYLPNDEPESDRLDFMHVAFHLTYGKKLFLSPVTKLENALDIGTGTGIWAIDLADEYPECQVVGTDLSPGQPDFIPPNLRFIVDDAEDPWVFPNRFDLIHARLMVGSFADWPKVFREAYKNLEPGGWLELQEFVVPVNSHDGTHENTNIFKWGQLLCEGARKLGRPMGADVCDLIVQQMQDVGFVDVQQFNFAWPTNTWPKDKFMKQLGLRTRISCTDGMEGLCLALLMRGLGWKKEEVDVFVALVKKDFEDRDIHAYIPMPVFFGRKPLEHEIPTG